MNICYECLTPVISLSYRSRCVHCEAANAKANRLENDHLREQLAAAEQRVAETCAKLAESSSAKGGLVIAEAIRNAEWREYL